MKSGSSQESEELESKLIPLKRKKKKKKNSLYSLRNFGSFLNAVFTPRASDRELSKIHLAFDRE